MYKRHQKLKNGIMNWLASRGSVQNHAHFFQRDQSALHHLIQSRQNLVDAFLRLRRIGGAPSCLLRVSGWLGENNRAYYNEQQRRIEEAGLADSFEHVESPDHASKVRFLQSLDVLSVPTTYREPKGLYVLEALANGVPVVQPRHGSFPELIEATQGGLLVEPGELGSDAVVEPGVAELESEDGAEVRAVEPAIAEAAPLASESTPAESSAMAISVYWPVPGWKRNAWVMPVDMACTRA